MKMIKGVVILALLMTLTLCMLNIAAASSISAAQPRSGSSTYHYHFQKFIPNTIYEQEDYPPVVSTNQMFPIYGKIMENNTTGVPNVGFNGPNSLFHGEIIANVPNPTMWKVGTDKHGNFVDNFQFNTQGYHDIIYTYIYGDGLADFCVSDVLRIYAVQANS